MLGQMMQVGFYGHVRQYKNIQADIDANIKRVLESGEYVQGPMLKQFEQELAAFHGVAHAAGTGNGTDAIWLALMAMGIGPGDEVITHPNTFFATAEAIWIAGATAVFVDCDPKTKCIDPAKIEAAITPRTKALIPVHLYGQVADMPAIKKIADAHGLRVIEDNAQAIDAAGDSFTIGQLSDATSVSFIIQKNLGTFGDGGALLTNNAEIDAAVRKLRNHGSTKRNVHSYGFNSRLDDLHAGVLSAKLKHIHAWNDQRIQWAARYTAGLKGGANFDLPHARPGTGTCSTSTSSKRRSRRIAISWSISWRRTGSTRRRTTRSRFISRTAIRGARARGLSARSPMPSATPRPASACRCIRS